MLLFSCVTLLSLFLFCAQPLKDLKLQSISNIVAEIDLYQFDLMLTAVNTNIVPVSIQQADLDVYASPEMAHFGEPDVDFFVDEILGHVRTLNGSAVFNPISRTSNVTARISIEYPSNTLGKLYLNSQVGFTCSFRIR